jgi:hypothetical protein
LQAQNKSVVHKQIDPESACRYRKFGQGTLAALAGMVAERSKAFWTADLLMARSARFAARENPMLGEFAVRGVFTGL